MNVNKAILVGRLGQDPEVRRTNNGNTAVSFSLATSESWRDKATGEKKERTEWHRVVIWNEHIGKIAEQYLKKGSECYLEGQIQTRKYTDKDGVERYTTEIVVPAFGGELQLGQKPGERTLAGAERNDRPRDTHGTGTGFGRSDESPEAKARRQQELLDDDIPF